MFNEKMFNEKKQMFVATSFLVLIIGGIVAAIAGAVRDKNTRVMIMRFSWIVLGAGGLLLIPGIGSGIGIPADIDLANLGGGDPLAVGTTPTTQLTPSGICAVEDTTVTLSAIDKFTAVATGGTHRYKINGAPAQTVSDAGTFTASPGDTLQVLWGNGSETISEYYNDVTNEVIPCSGTKIFSNELLQNGSITIDVFNEDGNRIDRNNNESLAAGDVVTLSAKLRGQFQRGTLGGVIVCEYNSSAYDDCIVDFGGVEVNVPSIYIITNTLSRTKAYSIPAVISTDILQGTVTIDVDDSINPVAAASALVNLTYYAADYFINEDTGASYDGPAVEDEDDVQTKEFIAYSEIFVS